MTTCTCGGNGVMQHESDCAVLRPTNGYVVKYRIAGFDGERTTEVYDSQPEAEHQAADIRGYEGVQYADVHVAGTSNG